MKRFTIATLAALLALACGDSPVEPVAGTIGNPTRRAPELAPGKCSQPGEVEQQYMDRPGYNPDGCLRGDRMAAVSPWDQHEDPDSDIGTVEQPITVSAGTDAAMSITVSNGKITGTRGQCRVNPGWTTAQPLSDTCLIPEVVSSLDWSVCPTCYAEQDRNYLRDIMKQGWGAWKRSVTCGGLTRSNRLKSATDSERTGGTPEENYDNARIPVVSINDSVETSYAARAMVDNDFIFSRTPVRMGVRYYSWRYAGIGFNHDLIEGFKLEACTDPGESQTSINKKLRNAYIWIAAHELGHLFGMPHRFSGIMRKSADTTCAEVYSSASPAPAFAAADAVELSIVALLEDSGGFSHANLPLAQSCGAGNAARAPVDDVFTGNLF